MRRIVVLGSDDVGKTTFLEKIGAEGSIKTTKTTSDGAEEEVEETVGLLWRILATRFPANQPRDE